MTLPDLPPIVWLVLCLPWAFALLMLARHWQDRPRRRRVSEDTTYADYLRLWEARRHGELLARLDKMIEAHDDV